MENNRIQITKAVYFLLAGALTGALMSALAGAGNAYADAYDDYSAFASVNFGAEKEPLIYNKEGSTLAVSADGSWIHASVYSAAIAWETNLPSRTRVEYGLTASLGLQTEWTDRHYYIHLHHVKNLLPQSTYYYRAVSVDERGNNLSGSLRTFVTDALGNRIRIPDDFPPGATYYSCNQQGRSYLLTRDIATPGRAIELNASGITLDLGGCTVVYNSSPVAVADRGNGYWDYINQSAYGVWIKPYMAEINFRVLNGIIKQGAGNGNAQEQGVGFSPVWWPGYGGELAGVSVEYSGAQICGIDCYYVSTDMSIHHNVITDRGTVIINRHQGCSAVRSAAVQHHNLVRRCRHGGMGTTAEMYDNEIHMDSWATNSIGFSVTQSTNAYRNNKIFGTGYHVVAVGWNLNDTSSVTIRDNIIHLAGIPPTTRSVEYDDQTSLNGFRLTQYNGGDDRYENWIYEGNLVSINVKGSGMINGSMNACQGRGIQLCSDVTIKDMLVRNNVIKVVADEADPNITNASCVVAQGASENWETSLPIIYASNTFISNFTHVRLGDYYASGSNHQFIGNRFIKTGNNPKYHTVYGGFWIYNSCRNRFVDNTFEGGASVSDVYWDGTGRLDYSVGWTIRLVTDPGAAVIVKDKDGAVEYMGTADGAGNAYPVLVRYLMQPAATGSHANLAVSRNPHTITVRKLGNEGTTTYNVSGMGETLVLGASYPSPPNQPPSVSLASPMNGLSVYTYTRMEISASCSDTDGAVTQVQFYDNGTLIGLDTEPPYRLEWELSTDGEHSLTARATDDRSATALSTAAVVTCVRRVIENCWNFDESSGNLAHDSLNASSTGTVSGAARAQGVKNGCLQFDGSGDSVRIDTGPHTGDQREITLAMWVRPAGWGSGGTLYDESDGEYWQFTIDDALWRTRDVSTGGSGSRNNDLPLPALSNGAWKHLAFVYSTQAGMKAIYVDGVLASSISVSVDRLTSDRSFACIGMGQDTPSFNGMIDEVYLFNRALSIPQIQGLMSGIIPDTGTPPAVANPGGSIAPVSFPNPCLGNGNVTFRNLPARTKLRIYTVSGKLVYETEQDTPSGSLVWNVLNSAGERVVTGIYLFSVSGPGYPVRTGKLALLR